MPAELPERYHRVVARHYEALLRYQPGIYPGKVTLFCTRAQPLLRAYSDNGWGHFAAGGLEVHKVEGNHLNFLEEPYVQVLAEKMRASLEQGRRAIASKDDDRAS